jgi:hypothetical protein
VDLGDQRLLMHRHAELQGRGRSSRRDARQPHALLPQKRQASPAAGRNAPTPKLAHHSHLDKSHLPRLRAQLDVGSSKRAINANKGCSSSSNSNSSSSSSSSRQLLRLPLQQSLGASRHNRGLVRKCDSPILILDRRLRVRITSKRNSETKPRSSCRL